MNDIEFLCPPDLIDRIPHPKRAAQFMPDWYRNLPRDIGRLDAQGLPGLSAKACLPMTDAMAQGWIIPLACDVTVGENQFGWLDFTWDADVPFAPVSDHHPAQIGAGRPPFLEVVPRKWVNPWRIKVPEGWSVLFCHPLNHVHLPFRVFDGWVDCDRFDVAVNAPFLWTAGRAQQVVPAGTPIFQVIPMQRSGRARDAVMRAETAQEVADRRHAETRKATEISVYRNEWRARPD